MTDTTFQSKVRKDITLSTDDLAYCAGTMFKAGDGQLSKAEALSEIQRITGVELLEGRGQGI